MGGCTGQWGGERSGTRLTRLSLPPIRTNHHPLANPPVPPQTLTPQQPIPHQTPPQAPATDPSACTSPAWRASPPTSSRRRISGWRRCRYVLVWGCGGVGVAGGDRFGGTVIAPITPHTPQHFDKTGGGPSCLGGRRRRSSLGIGQRTNQQQQQQEAAAAPPATATAARATDQAGQDDDGSGGRGW